MNNIPTVLIFSAALFFSMTAQAQVSADFSMGGGVKVGAASAMLCDLTNTDAEGSLRYSSSSRSVEYCDGVAWQKYEQVSGEQPILQPINTGYFIITKTRWNGNLGNLAGADQKCLTELTTNTDWMGFADANARGLLIANKVRAFLCRTLNGNQDGPCNTPIPLATYYFARVGAPNVGGASFTADGEGRGPQDNNMWSSYNYFGGTYLYHSYQSTISTSLWGNVGGSFGYDCSNWTSGASTLAQYGNTSATDNKRWRDSGYLSCAEEREIICMVDP